MANDRPKASQIRPKPKIEPDDDIRPGKDIRPNAIRVLIKKRNEGRGKNRPRFEITVYLDGNVAAGNYLVTVKNPSTTCRAKDIEYSVYLEEATDCVEYTSMDENCFVDGLAVGEYDNFIADLNLEDNGIVATKNPYEHLKGSVEGLGVVSRVSNFMKRRRDK